MENGVKNADSGFQKWPLTSRMDRCSRGTNCSRAWRFTKATVLVATAAVIAISASGQDKPTPTDSGSDLLWKKAESRIDEIAMRFDGAMGVAIVDLTDGRALVRNAEHVFPAASSIKLAILLELYRQDDQARAGAKGEGDIG
jgi:beta-lactamase class A